MFGIIIPGVSNKKTNGSSETRIFVCKALVMPGLAPTFIGFPFKFKVALRNKLIKDDLPTLGMPQISKLESGENFLLNRSLSEQVNLCQKLLFLHQLIHNMTTDCSLNYKFNT